MKTFYVSFWTVLALLMLQQVSARPAFLWPIVFAKHGHGHGLSVNIEKGPFTVTVVKGQATSQPTESTTTGTDNGGAGDGPKELPARAICTNMLGGDGFPMDSDPCRVAEDVWCCAGLVSNTQIKTPCVLLGPQGTRAQCGSNSATPMRFCCPLARPGPGPREG